jgi:predicted Fe-S protein YdhL (DUF1289 family)
MGCYRSIVEITQWQQMNDRMRQDVLLKAKNRRKVDDTKGSILKKEET